MLSIFEKIKPQKNFPAVLCSVVQLQRQAPRGADRGACAFLKVKLAADRNIFSFPLQF